MKESLIGKKYRPHDNSWSINVTTCSNYPYKNKQGYLAGTHNTSQKECIICSEPFDCYINKSVLHFNLEICKMIMVNFNQETHMVLFNESSVVKEPKFKAGDWVTVLDTPRIRRWTHGEQAIRHTFQIRKDGHYCELFLEGSAQAIDLNNKYYINYTLNDVRLATPEEIKASTNKEPEMGKWYTLIDYPKYLVCFTKEGRYGFNSDGEWFSSNVGNYWEAEYTLASDEFVKERLLEYAKEHYPIGTKFCSAWYQPCKVTVENRSFYAINYNNELHIVVNANNGASVFYNGKWAEITEKPKNLKIIHEFTVNNIDYIVMLKH